MGGDSGVSIKILFTEAGAKRWALLTANSVGKRLPLFLQGKLIGIPGIRQPLFGKWLEISGGFNEKEAREAVGKIQRPRGAIRSSQVARLRGSPVLPQAHGEY